ncbi:TetR/AcrR family transcriptional regulator [Phenylobacterium terrae]|uniref:TetR/AcrR family transcriptional regulator n=1 Tax=Phenylobacterium terrae TaxID=2665495 RepID=A0ABW4MV15_9CAUL
MKDDAGPAEAQERLLQAALDLLHEDGPSGVSARAVGDRAGVSASSVNYHFGGRDGLLARAFGHAGAEAQRWRAAALAAAPPSAPAQTLAAWTASLVQDLCSRRDLLLVSREFRQLAARTPGLAALAREDQVQADAFWREIVQRCGLPAALAGPVADFAAGATLTHGRGADWRLELPWLLQSCERLAARLRGARAGLPGWDGWRALAERQAAAAIGPWTAPASEAAIRMLDAGIGIVGAQGVEGLTHRAVARAAGASLANVTHHFPTRSALVHAAFRRLHSRLVAAGSDAGRAGPSELSIAAVADGLAGVVVDAHGGLRPEPIALEELIMSAGRDPAIRDVAMQLRAGRGEGSVATLQSLRPRGDPPDRLDAHLLSTVLMGAIRGVYGVDPRERRAWLTRRAMADVDALFG